MSEHTETVKDLLTAANLAEKSGDFDKAIRLSGRVITRIPGSSKARKAISKLGRKLGRYQSLQQSDVDFALGELNKGHLQSCIDICGILLTLAPKETVIHDLLGRAFFARSDLNNAGKSFKIAIKLSAKNFEALNNLGSTYLQALQLEPAIAEFEKAINVNPKFAQAHHNLAVAFDKRGDGALALSSIDRALSLSGIHPIPAKTKALLLRNAGKTSEAIDFLRQCLDVHPNSVSLMSDLGQTFSMLGDNVSAEKTLVSVAMLDAEIWQYKPDEMLEYCRACLSLARLRKMTSDDPILLRLKAVHALAQCTGEARISIDFALGKAFEDIRDYSTAFAYYEQGNTAKRKTTLPYSTQHRLQEVADIKTDFAENWKQIKRIPEGTESRPIFIVGMPRSGTSLAEQILSSHSLVFGAGELSAFERFAVKNARRQGVPTKSELEDFAQAYLNEALQNARGENVFTDKMPINFNWIGVIKSVFPEAKIVLMTRDPRDICLSNFKNLFANRTLQFTYDLIEFAEYYLTFSDLMSFWHNEFPDEIHVCCYDSLVQDQEAETRKLLKYCGLDWEDRVLEFHKNKRLVKTASLAQVSQKLYSSSVASWKKFEHQLAPAIDILKAGGALSPD